MKCVDCSDEMLESLKKCYGSRNKKKTIGNLFIRVFEKYKNELENKLNKKVRFLLQGTIYPDVIESCGNNSKTIKSHHNVGGLPENFDFELIEPLRNLFKDEVRKLGPSLKIPKDFIERHPFPGPGLAIRIMGSINKEKLDILRKADEILFNILENTIFITKFGKHL